MTERVEIFSYTRHHDRWTTTLKLDPQGIEICTQGRGLLDRRKSVRIPLKNLTNFALVPTVAIQHVQGGKLHNPVTDFSYDSELFLSWTTSEGKAKKKRLFVDARSDTFQGILRCLREQRPDASLSPEDAHRRMGFLTPRQTVWIIVGLLVGLPVLGAGIILLVAGLTGRLS